ncbi:hypothetical protein NHP164001_11970 [Helicobacter trogontum]|uniref:Uncharacterized protein n=1 Tax=Helicobacter trogontum TaxID=50960 RepID=A0ABQ0D4B1_9HELI
MNGGMARGDHKIYFEDGKLAAVAHYDENGVLQFVRCGSKKNLKRGETSQFWSMVVNKSQVQYCDIQLLNSKR